MDGAAESWVHWWFAAGDLQNPQWGSGSGRGYDDIARFPPTSRHELIAASRNVLLQQPPEPHEGLLCWVGLCEVKQELALRLVEDICASQQATSQCPTAHGNWCRSLAKALRPGLWVPPVQVDARLLLGAWIGAERWARAKLQWPEADLGMPPPGLPGKRLDALWSAVLWRVSQASAHAD